MIEYVAEVKEADNIQKISYYTNNLGYGLFSERGQILSINEFHALNTKQFKKEFNKRFNDKISKKFDIAMEIIKISKVGK